MRPSRCLPAPRIFSRSGLSSGRTSSSDFLEENLAVADDRVQWRPELVAHAGEEVRFRLARPYGLVARRGELGGALPHELLQMIIELLQPDVRVVDLARLLLGDRLCGFARPLSLAPGAA